MSRIADIEFEASGLKFALSPLKQKQAGRVFHTSVSQMIAAFSSVESFKNEDSVIRGLIKGFSEIDYDQLWDLAEILCKGAFVDEKEIKSIEDLEAMAEKPWILYLIIFYGVRGNWPRVFSELEAKGSVFVSRFKTAMATKMAAMGMATEDSLSPTGK